ncbi:MAG: sugar ABC transporter permease [Lachnospiraceae bacterium]|nr:sugar ABC transporter permease [Lachnospiraceae bacterium]
MFFPAFNPAKVCALVNENLSLFTSAISYSSLTSDCARAFRVGWVDESVFILLFVASIIMLLGVILAIVGGCMSVGNNKMQKTGLLFSMGGGVLVIAGAVLCIVSYTMAQGSPKIERVKPEFPTAIIIYIVVGALILLLSAFLNVKLPKPAKDAKFEIESKYKLFLMFMPFAALAFVFCYLPLWGWRYAFFDYQAGGSLSMDNFVGFKWFAYLFQNAATRKDIVRVIKNTLAMSGLNICTSWLPMMFAIFLCEVKNMRFRRFVQTFTTIPNFISWILVYAIALSIFSTDGFINTFAKEFHLMAEEATGKNYLMGDSFTWVKMWLWGTWKGVGWSAIIYIAGISGIDQQLYEAAEIDGAGRFQRMWNITVPGLLPTFFVLLLMSIANILTNGLDQYLVFMNAQNKDTIEVLDLYVYQLGIGGSSIPLSTVVGMFKSVISVVLLFAANGVSKKLRGESII